MEILRGTLNRIDRGDLTPGDHIYSWRLSLVYAHHGIYVGEEMVIHFTTRDQDGPGNVSSSTVSRSTNNPCPICGYHSNRDGGVIYTCLDCFLKGGKLHRYRYYISRLVSDIGVCRDVAKEPPGLDEQAKANKVTKEE